MKTKIKLLLISVFVGLLALQGNAQQDPQFTQYYFNPLLVNSGYAGTRDAVSVNLVVREQWIGLDGAPKGQSLSLHSPISNTALSAGGSFIRDLHGPVRSSYLNLDGAYQFRTTEKTKLNLGLRASFHWYNAQLGALETGGDVSFQQNIKSQALPNFGVSAFWYSKTHFVGLSAPRLLENLVSNGDYLVESLQEKRHFFLTAGKVFTLNDKIKFKPTTLFKYVHSAPLSLDLSGNLLFFEKLWAGAFIRVKDSMGIMASYIIDNTWQIGYSHDRTTSALSGFHAGSHEFMITYDFRFKKGRTMSPRYF